MEECGIKRDVGFPSISLNNTKDIELLVHEDDSCAARPSDDVLWLKRKLELKFELNTQHLGFGDRPSCERKKSESQVLNRAIHATNSGWATQVDLRHGDLILEQLGLSDLRGFGLQESTQRTWRRKQS